MPTAKTKPILTTATRALAPVRRRIAPRVDELVLRRYRTLEKRQRKGADGGLTRESSETLKRLVASGVKDGTLTREVEHDVLEAFRAVAEGDIGGRRRSPAARRTLVDEFHRLYYHSRNQTWSKTYWRGVRLLKNPLDLWLYQEIIHEVRPDVIFEAGTRYGGTAYYLADLCDLEGHGRIATVDIEVFPNRPEHPRISYFTGSSTDPAIIAQIDEIILGGRVLVILDSDHSRDHVLGELRAWHSRVAVGSYLIVEDSNINGHPVATSWGPGPMEAVDAFLAENDDFVIDESMHKFFMTFNPRGYLKRVK